MPKLILVPTPVGNLQDITLRAIDVLKSADLILAEDTRTSGNLLRHLGISKPLRAYHAHNEHKVVEDLVSQIESGATVALMTDAGTPGISDPGFLIVRECVRQQVEVETLPGPTAFVPALVNSGLPCDRFCFEGFLPQKKGRQTRLKKLIGEERTMIFYESPFRLVKALRELATIFGVSRLACVSRELSKIHEENRRGTLEELIIHYEKHPPKGEIVIVVAGIDKRENNQESDDEAESD
jgi:16S rRNA (cytidine1402-2'-O)-methyltransferase